MLYLLQSILVNDTPAIYLGTNIKKEHLYLVEAEKGHTTQSQDNFDGMDWIRIDDASSPTGKSIYRGSLCKNIIAGEWRMKLPPNDLIIQEFKNIKNKI